VKKLEHLLNIGIEISRLHLRFHPFLIIARIRLMILACAPIRLRQCP
jgi:hypothetical protein